MLPGINNIEHENFLEFQSWLRSRGRKDATLETYSAAHRVFFGAGGIARSISELAAIDLRQWRAKAIDAGAKPATINMRLGFLRQYSQWAHERALINASQKDAIVAVADVPSTKLGAKTLSDSELQRFVAVVETMASHRDKSIVFLLLSGLRVSEVCGLTRHDVVINAHRGHLEIRGTHVKFSAERQVPLGKQARFYLQKHLDDAAPVDHVFYGQRGKLTTNGVFKIVQRIGSTVGLKLHPHILRHQFAKLWLTASVNDIVGLQAILGHSSITTTSRFHCRKSLMELQAGVDALRV
jgi:integrase/recombinase XerD